MEEIKTKAIVLKTTDYGEADKIASLFSLEYGKISAKFVGVKRAKAKLRYLIQPFSFIELECMKRQDFYMVKTGGVIDSFPNIISDYSKTICGYIVVDIIDKILLKNKVEKDIFLLTANPLKVSIIQTRYLMIHRLMAEIMSLLSNSQSISENSIVFQRKL